MQKVLNKYGMVQRQQMEAQRKSHKEPKSFLLSALDRLRDKVGFNVRIVPAALAVVIQCVALLSVIGVVWSCRWLSSASFGFNVNFSIFSLVVMQAIFAATLSYIARMASWWRWIHLCFPLTAWAMFQWQIPNEVYLVGFIISLSLFWTTFRTQVPFFPSRPKVWQQVAKIIPQNQSVRLIDIGSGLGDMSMYMAKIRPDSQIEGIEIAPLPWLISFIRAKLRRSPANFKLGDYTALNFANYDVIFAYLSPAAMRLLWDKASKEMRPGSMLISLEFEIPGVDASMHIAGSHHHPDIYVWRIS